MLTLDLITALLGITNELYNCFITKKSVTVEHFKTPDREKQQHTSVELLHLNVCGMGWGGGGGGVQL